MTNDTTPTQVARIVSELSEDERKCAVKAYESAHGCPPDFDFAPDRAWLEGFAAALRSPGPQAASQGVEAFALPDLPKAFRVEQPAHREPYSLFTARQMIDYRLAPPAPALASDCGICKGDPEACDVHDCGDAHKPASETAAGAVTDEQIISLGRQTLTDGSDDEVLNFARAILALATPPAATQPPTKLPLTLFYPRGTIFDSTPSVVLDGNFTAEALRQILSTLES